MNCGTCTHWNLKGSPTRAAGFGLCKVEPNEMMRAGRMLAPHFACTIGKFVKADAVALARREKALG